MIDTPDKARRAQRQRILLAILLLLLVVLLVKALLVGRHAYVLWQHGMRLRGLMADPAAVFDPQEPALIQADLAAIEEALRGVRAELGWVLRPAWLPWDRARMNLLAVDGLLGVGASLAHAGQEAVEGLGSLAGAMASRGSSHGTQDPLGMSEALFAGLLGARPHFARAAPQVAEAASDVGALPLDQLWSPLSLLVPELEQYLQLGSQALEAAAASPKLLGEASPANYMILAQNSDELRATGGWITGIGLATLDHGSIEQIVIEDSYAVDRFAVQHPWPPEPMTRYMGIDQWATRDGNWSPDFPTAAGDVERLYHMENSTEFTGIVAFDMYAMQILLDAVGPLYLEEYQDHVTGDNVMQKARDYWNPPLPEGLTYREWAQQMGWEQIRDDWWLHRKDFMGLMAEAFLSKLQEDLQPDRLSALLWATKRAVDEKHVLLYFHEPAVQGLLQSLGMDGSLEHEAYEDYLLVVDSNLGYNKVNLNIRSEVDYEVTLDASGGAVAELAITYSNRSPAQSACVHQSRIEPTYDLMAQDCYWNYLRVYVPKGANLLSVQGVAEAETLTGEYGYTVFGAFLVVPAAESSTVRFTYELPDWSGDEYKLLVQKQAGTMAVPLTVRVVPEGMEVVSAVPQPKREQTGALAYELSLRQDCSLALKLR